MLRVCSWLLTSSCDIRQVNVKSRIIKKSEIGKDRLQWITWRKQLLELLVCLGSVVWVLQHYAEFAMPAMLWLLWRFIDETYWSLCLGAHKWQMMEGFWSTKIYYMAQYLCLQYATECKNVHCETSLVISCNHTSLSLFITIATRIMYGRCIYNYYSL